MSGEAQSRTAGRNHDITLPSSDPNPTLLLPNTRLELRHKSVAVQETE